MICDVFVYDWILSHYFLKKMSSRQIIKYIFIWKNYQIKNTITNWNSPVIVI